MGDSFSVSREAEIRQITMGRPHVVIVGAGASRAALPAGDANGNRLPVMADFADLVAISPIFERNGIAIDRGNFEETYSFLKSDPEHTEDAEELESIIFEYFARLALPPEPTIYDLLLLSLRPKDVVATFNWDPFLIQAARRHPILGGKLPLIHFLHGNVLAGFCDRDRVHGVRGARCSRCGTPFSASRLLYPVANKDYESDPQISDAWRAFRSALQSAFMLTVFGYGAWASDVAAMDSIRRAWGPGCDRPMEQFEAIDICPEDELRARWADLIHTHHYEVHTQFQESWIANHPRRSGEAYLNQYLEAKFIEENRVP